MAEVTGSVGGTLGHMPAAHGRVPNDTDISKAMSLAKLKGPVDESIKDVVRDYFEGRVSRSDVVKQFHVRDAEDGAEEGDKLVRSFNRVVAELDSANYAIRRKADTSTQTDAVAHGVITPEAPRSAAAASTIAYVASGSIPSTKSFAHSPPVATTPPSPVTIPTPAAPPFNLDAVVSAFGSKVGEELKKVLKPLTNEQFVAVLLSADWNLPWHHSNIYAKFLPELNKSPFPDDLVKAFAKALGNIRQASEALQWLTTLKDGMPNGVSFSNEVFMSLTNDQFVQVLMNIDPPEDQSIILQRLAPLLSSTPFPEDFIRAFSDAFADSGKEARAQEWLEIIRDQGPNGVAFTDAVKEHYRGRRAL